MVRVGGLVQTLQRLWRKLGQAAGLAVCGPRALCRTLPAAGPEARGNQIAGGQNNVCPSADALGPGDRLEILEPRASQKTLLAQRDDIPGCRCLPARSRLRAQLPLGSPARVARATPYLYPDRVIPSRRPPAISQVGEPARADSSADPQTTAAP